MSAYLAERIEKPKFFGLRPLKSGRGKRTPYVVGFDSEAENGRPFLFQFSLPEHASEDETILVVIEQLPNAGLDVFIEFLAEYCTRKDTEYLVYGHNIQYEFTQLFADAVPDLVGPDGLPALKEFGFVFVDLNGSRWEIKVANDKRYFATFTNVSTKRQIRLLDTYAFYKTSLANMAKMLSLPDKYSSETLDRSHFTRADLNNPEFLMYARRDAYITRLAGEQIVQMHRDYDVTTCISAPHFASKVFKHQYLGGEIALPSPKLEQYGLWSYHGGKNGFYVPDPARIPNIYQYDITSAYPEAMRQLPNPVTAAWVPVSDYVPGRHAIYRATLDYRQCTYRGFLNIDGTWPGGGYIEDAYLTSYELDAMVDMGECTIKTIDGYAMEGEPGGPLVQYVDEFFAMKANSTGAKRETAKLFLNSLYGKFFQKVSLGSVGMLVLDFSDPAKSHWVETNEGLPFDWRAGGLYHPPIASLITGYVRAKIHRLEHRYGSLMTSTDGIFGTQPPVESDLGKHLGGLTMLPGDLDIWRERLYIFRPHDGSKPKVALHGFQADADTLARIPLAHGTHAYEATQMITLQLATRNVEGERHRAGEFVRVRKEITI